MNPVPPNDSCPVCGTPTPPGQADRRFTCGTCGWEESGAPHRGGGQKRRVAAAGWLAMGLIIAGVSIWQSVSWSPFFFEALPLRIKHTLGLATVDDLLALGALCNTLSRHHCSRTVYGSIIHDRPDDPRVVANFAMALSNSGDFAGALPYYERYLALGGGAVDALYGYARTLRGVGRRDEAIRWYYGTIQANPKLLDATAGLIELLIQGGRRVEALSVIRAFVRGLPNYKGYWAGQIIAIEAGMDQGAGSRTDATRPIRIPAIGQHHYVPLRLGGGSHYEPFIVDTGATALTFNSTWAEDVQVPLRRTGKRIILETATGFAQAEQVFLPEVMVGSIPMKDVEAVMCSSCAPLMGHSLLDRFDMKTTRVDSIEFLSLTPR